MSVDKFKAMIVTETKPKSFERKIGQREITSLPSGEVLIKVHYSSLNYKDALSASGNKGVTRKYPHTPGIDAAGTVAESKADRFSPGQNVLVTGYDLGMNTSGGFGEYIRVPADWVVKLPDNLSLKESMAFGTAGFTAGLSVNKLINAKVSPDAGDILVTGASGGVGSIAVAILAKIGYRVVAASGKDESRDFLKTLGAAEVVNREEVSDQSKRALLGARWAAAVDTVGGQVLETVLRTTRAKGVVTCCGNVASGDLSLSIYPFILRGISLLGVDSAETPMPLRLEIWNKLATDWKPLVLDKLYSLISFEELDSNIEKILSGGQIGRRVIKVKS